MMNVTIIYLFNNKSERARRPPTKYIQYTLCLKNDTAFASYNFDEHERILAMFLQKCCFKSKQFNDTLFSHFI